METVDAMMFVQRNACFDTCYPCCEPCTLSRSPAIVSAAITRIASSCIVSGTMGHVGSLLPDQNQTGIVPLAVYSVASIDDRKLRKLMLPPSTLVF